MTTFAGLFWYEIVLLVLGILLFVVLLSALRSALAAGKSYAGLLPFFLLTIVMIGYPSIKSIQYKDGMLEIDNETNQIESSPGDPQNAARRQTLEAHLNQLADRAASEQDKQKIAQARAALKPRTPVENQSHNLLKPNTGQTPDPLSSLQSQNTAELRARVLALTQQAESDPKNAALRKQLKEAAERLKASGGSAPVNAAVIKRAENFLAPWGETVN